MRRVAMVVFEGVQSLDLTGPLEVFSAASQLAPKGPAYELRVLATRRGLVRCSSGLRVAVDGTLAGERGSVDTLVVAGGPGTVAALKDRRLLRGIARLARRA